MTSAKRIRVSGQIKQSVRGIILTSGEDVVWVLEPTDDIQLPANGKVIVEGIKIGFDRLSVSWMTNAEM